MFPEFEKPFKDKVSFMTSLLIWNSFFFFFKFMNKTMLCFKRMRNCATTYSLAVLRDFSASRPHEYELTSP